MVNATMEAWAQLDDADPISVLFIEKGKFEVVRRVAAENRSSDAYYILADVGCVPTDPQFISTAASRMGSGIGLASPRGYKDQQYPQGIRVCRKFAVKRWPEKVTNSYDKEHADAVRLSGKKVIIWDDLEYKPLLQC